MSMTARTIEYTFRERHLLAMSTIAACLGGIGRVDSNVSSAIFFRFAREFAEKFRPRGVCNAFGETMVVGQTVHGQVLHTDDTVGVHDTAALLMGEVITAEVDALMYSCNEFAMLALHFCQCLFLFPEEAWVLYLSAIRERGKRLESYVDANLRGALRQSLRITLDRERGIPLASRGTMNGERLDLALDRAVIDKLDTANLGEAHPIIVGGCLGGRDNAESRLRIGEAVITPFAFETRIAQLFFVLDTPEESLESQFHPFRDILQDLRVNRFQRRTFHFQQGNASFRVIIRHIALLLFPCLFAVCQRVVIQPTAFLKRSFKSFPLVLARIHPVQKRFSHTRQYSTFLRCNTSVI